MSDIADLTGIISESTNITVETESFINYIDYSMRIVSLIIHIIYLLCIWRIKDLQTRQLLYLHHVNIIGLIYTVHYVCYIFGQSPDFGSAFANDLVCNISSMIWMITKFMRMFSLLLLAIYRYTAVYYITLHRNFTRSLGYMILAIMVTWIIAVLFSISFKYSFNTTYSIFYCFEGDSEDLSLVTWFMIINNTFAIVLPSILIAYLYLRIVHRINEVNKNLSMKKVRTASDEIKSFSSRVCYIYYLTTQVH